MGVRLNVYWCFSTRKNASICVSICFTESYETSLVIFGQTVQKLLATILIVHISWPLGGAVLRLRRKPQVMSVITIDCKKHDVVSVTSPVVFWRAFLKLKVGGDSCRHLDCVSLPDNWKWAKRRDEGGAGCWNPAHQAQQQRQSTCHSSVHALNYAELLGLI